MYVPRRDQFRAAISAAWIERHPDVRLHFVDYDCYADDPPAELDVFGFDCILMSYFISKGYLTPLPSLKSPDDFYPYALAAATADASQAPPYYGVPYLGCVNAMIYRAGDDAVAEARSLDELHAALGDATDGGPEPPPQSGLLIDLTGGTSDACLYLQTWEELQNSYPPDPLLPSGDELDPAVLANLNQLEDMAGCSQAWYDDPGTDRVTWFGGGAGRAFVTVTETMSAIPVQHVDDLRVRELPLTARRPYQPMFADVMAVNAAIDPGKRDLAIELANLVGSADTMLASLRPDTSASNPQYLISARPSVLRSLAEEWPIYAQIRELIATHEPRAFRIDSRAREWLDATKQAIADTIRGEDCPGELATEQPHPAEAHLPVHLFRIV